MKAKLETLSVSVLREFAKDKNIKNISTMRKSELIDAISHTIRVSSMLKKIRKIIIMHSQDKSMMLHWQMEYLRFYRTVMDL